MGDFFSSQSHAMISYSRIRTQYRLLEYLQLQLPILCQAPDSPAPLKLCKKL